MSLHQFIFRCSAVLLIMSVTTTASLAQAPTPLPKEKREALESAVVELNHALKLAENREHVADAAIFAKGLEWALRYDTDFTTADLGQMEKAIERTRQRLNDLPQKQPWKDRRGKVALGYRSRVDGSYQPYGLIVPAGYKPDTPMRLDVVLHGSTRPVGMSELRFIARFDEGDGANASPPNQPYLELHPLGRVENCYRWAGETDVFEAIDDVCRRYTVDRDRIVLRGMSMGASGSWHLGLKHPDRFVALGPYCGYVDTHRFSETPLPNFVKVGQLPEHQERGLHMLDSIDYAANAGIVPAIACMGEKDIFFQAHVLMGDAMRREGLTMVNLISPGTGHVIDPVTHAEQMRRIGEFASSGLNRTPDSLRFVTWTLKYSECHWMQVLALNQHYSRAEFSARRSDDAITIQSLTNISRFAIRREWRTSPFDTDGSSTYKLEKLPKTVSIGDVNIAVAEERRLAKRLVFSMKSGQWQLEAGDEVDTNRVKRPGLQGPIDDAFATPFLCVRGTGQSWNPAAQKYAAASLKRFRQEWHHYFRGELLIKDDTAVTDEDLRNRNLILFGDPGSNSWIARVLPGLDITWTPEKLRVGETEYPSENQLPALISPNPLPGAVGRYVVLNSGHTFREAELNKLNYLLFPRWGDWAVLKISGATELADEEVIRAGYFNEDWRFNRQP